MKPVLIALKRERASDSVYQTLRDCILLQTFQPGERLNVRELATKLGVSLTPVKEAINRLATEGLVEINPRSGTYVTEISPEDVKETFEIRLALECLAVEKCIERMNGEDLEQLRETVTELNAPAVTERDYALHERHNVDFHSKIVALSGNRRLIELYNGLNAHIKIARIHMSRVGWESRMEQERQEHTVIFEAIENRDRVGAVQALRQHIRRAADCLVADLVRNTNGKSAQVKESAQ